MFDMARFTREARSGVPVDPSGLIEYLSGFRNILLWGASHLGRAVERDLRGRGPRIARFWDERAAAITDLPDFTVSEPFTGDLDPAGTEVIVTFSNDLESIHEGQREMFHQNVAQVREAGVFVSVGVAIPQWSIPPTMEANDHARVRHRKAYCRAQ